MTTDRTDSLRISRKLRTAVRVVPVVFRAPLVRFHVPPLVVLRPAIFARFRQFVSRMLSLLAVIAVMLDRFMQIVVGFLGAVLALRSRSPSRVARL